MTNEELKLKAQEIRIKIIKMLTEAKSGHTGGSLSITDILTVLYFDEMRIAPNKPDAVDRDRFILSKGHAAPALYAVLCERGYFDEEELFKLRKINANLQGHPSIHTPGVDMSTGSLGQGLSAANGMAISLKLDGKDARVYVALGDGECQEGQIWEAAMTSAHYKLDNLTAFVDVNGLQIDGATKDVMSVEPIAYKFRAFGWNALDINGHDIEAIRAALAVARTTKGKPTVIVAKTVKGKGVSFMENQYAWHGKSPNAEQCRQAIKELQA